VMMERRSPMRAFMRVDLPTLGLPMMDTNPERNAGDGWSVDFFDILLNYSVKVLVFA
jgi:hypothetical protein